MSLLAFKTVFCHLNGFINPPMAILSSSSHKTLGAELDCPVTKHLKVFNKKIIVLSVISGEADFHLIYLHFTNRMRRGKVSFMLSILTLYFNKQYILRT